MDLKDCYCRTFSIFSSSFIIFWHFSEKQLDLGSGITRALILVIAVGWISLQDAVIPSGVPWLATSVRGGCVSWLVCCQKCSNDSIILLLWSCKQSLWFPHISPWRLWKTPRHPNGLNSKGAQYEQLRQTVIQSLGSDALLLSLGGPRGSGFGQPVTFQWLDLVWVAVAFELSAQEVSPMESQKI